MVWLAKQLPTSARRRFRAVTSSLHDETGTVALRLDVHNGLLLSALWDAAFDTGLNSFADDGTVLRSPQLTEAAAKALNLANAASIPLTPQHRQNLARHLAKHGYQP